MENIQINRTTLLEILQTNRAQHIKEYEEAVVDHKALSIKVAKENAKQMKANVKAVNAGKLYQHLTGLKNGPQAPTSHEKEYNRAIRAVELDVRETIELQEDVFNQLVMDEWTWKEAFTVSNTTYKAGLGR